MLAGKSWGKTGIKRENAGKGGNVNDKPSSSSGNDLLKNECSARLTKKREREREK